jgi:predicted ATP-grasp superfamily ATP-dependent carboligase
MLHSTGYVAARGRVLLTDGDQRSTLAAVRSLGTAGHEVLVCSTRRKPLAGASRFCRGEFTVPDPALGVGGYREGVRRLVEEQKVDVLIPMTDRSASTLLDLRLAHPSLVIPFPSKSTYEAVADKRLLLQTAHELGVPVPDQVVLTSPRDVPDGADPRLDSIGPPYVLKPARSAVVGETGSLSLRVRVVNSRSELPEALAAFPAEAYPILVQSRVSGPGVGVFVLCGGGEIVASFAHRRIREKPPTGGISVYRESTELRSDVLEYSQRLMRRFSWDGVAMVEFKEDELTGVPYLMEVNGRFWGSLQLAIDAGIDFPRLLVAAALGDRDSCPAGYRTGVRSRWLWGDVDHLVWILRAPRGYRADNPFLPSRIGALGRFLVPWRPKERLEVLRLRDVRPFLRESVQWFRHLLTPTR